METQGDKGRYGEPSRFNGVIGACPYSVWKCKPGKLYHIQLKDGTRYVAKHLLCLEFCILFKTGNKPIRYSFDYTDKVYAYQTAKERVQEQMEARALRLILRRATGDELFSWY